ncbi:porin [Candidatus Methylopumilus universalis]|uniref:porin n=1 Tax=Candidatus Methylopumilus universalis TaxID=2588536 RepID=UPI00111FB8C3|nr:porin [Candidatus Methylopumilus universalis]QDC88442.1 porin [Candidatus Methylopumilus universalis]
MNKNIKLAVAGAVLALSASAANAGIVIPAGDWTLDISGNVNSFYSNYNAEKVATVNGGIAGSGADKSVNSIGTGLLPNFLSIGGSTRQNDIDVAFAISLQPGGDVGSAGANGTQNNRQAYLTFGDKSWGSIKLGKDLGIFASDAILNDMTLLGMGAGAGLGNASYGRIGTGFIYADWKSQVAYTTPNFNGFQATAGLSNSWNPTATGQTAADLDGSTVSATGASRGGANPAFEGKASYSFAVNDVTGKVWVSGIKQHVRLQNNTAINPDSDGWAADVGANINVAGLGLTGYYYSGEGIGSTFQFLDAFAASGKKRDSDGGYVQATYVLPFKTKIGASWGKSNLDLASGETAAANGALLKENEMWTVGAYHPLTKHLNLVAEYSNIDSKSQGGAKQEANSVSLGGILFF